MAEPASVPPVTRSRSAVKPPPFSRYQKFVVAVLAFLQFTIILDFMIMAPMGAILMPALNISTVQFGKVVSVYAFSAGLSGLLAAGFADKFDRKKLLMFFYVGFLLGTLFCGLAPSYPLLLAARMITGLFGGVIGSIVFAITTDLFPMEMRGRVMGTVQTAFAASQVLGIPFGLYLSTYWGWHAPFLMIVAAGVLGGIAIWARLEPIDAHLKLQTSNNPFRHLTNTIKRPRNLHAFATTALLSTGGFMMMPFASAFTVNNLGISLQRLPMVYMITGVFSMISGPLIGRAADMFGRLKLFMIGSVVMSAVVLYYSRLGVTPIAAVILINILMWVGISSRMVSSSAMMSAIPDPASRGSFMSVSSSIQQVAGGIASIVAGLIVVQTAAGPLERFDVLSNVVAAANVITMIMMYSIHRAISKGSGLAPTPTAKPLP